MHVLTAPLQDNDNSFSVGACVAGIDLVEIQYIRHGITLAPGLGRCGRRRSCDGGHGNKLLHSTLPARAISTLYRLSEERVNPMFTSAMVRRLHVCSWGRR